MASSGVNSSSKRINLRCQAATGAGQVDHALESKRDSQAVAQPRLGRLGPGSDVRL
jgi:hypothetical protein